MRARVTFGARYAETRHPCDKRAHPDGWFEFDAATLGGIYLAVAHVLTDRQRVARYERVWTGKPPVGRVFPRGALARYRWDGERAVDVSDELDHAPDSGPEYGDLLDRIK